MENSNNPPPSSSWLAAWTSNWAMGKFVFVEDMDKDYGWEVVVCEIWCGGIGEGLIHPLPKDIYDYSIENKHIHV